VQVKPQLSEIKKLSGKAKTNGESRMA